MRESCVLYKSFFDAIADFPPESYKAAVEAVRNYAFEGTEPEGLGLLEKAVFTLVKPQVDANNERYESSLAGGRERKELPPAEELRRLHDELGGWDAVASSLGTGKATIFRRLKAAAPQGGEVSQEVSQVSKESQFSKPNVHVHDNENENERESQSETANEAAEPAACAAPPSVSLSASKAQGKRERAARKNKPFLPPTVEEVAAYLQKMGYSYSARRFVAWYEPLCWRGAKSIGWQAKADQWAAAERDIPQGKARASPPAPRYKTWTAPPPPDISDEERAAICEGLNGVLCKLKPKQAGKEAAR